MKKAFLYFLGVTTCSLLIYWSFFYEPRLLKIRHETFHWNQKSLKIVFFSDLHAGSPFIDLKYIGQLVAAINNEKPDLILIGGDFVINEVIGGHPISLKEVAAKLSLLKSRYGTFTVLGNHDWWNDSSSILESLKKAKIQVLENESIVVNTNDHFKFNLIGLGDDMTQHSDANHALKDLHNDLPRIALMHDPGSILDFPMSTSFDLALAGHMHGGQVNLPFLGPLITPGRAPKKWANGWTDLPQGKLFVTNGIGTSILPIRLNAPPEIVVIEMTQ